MDSRTGTPEAGRSMTGKSSGTPRGLERKAVARERNPQKAAPRGSPSVSSAPAGSAPRSPPRCSSQGTARSPRPASPTPPYAGPPRCSRMFRWSPPPRCWPRADLVLLTVPDDALPDLVSGLAETGAVRPGQLLVHTSGRYGTRVLDPALRAGALPLALHPAMTFTGTSVDVQRLAGCSFGVTAPEELRLAAEALVIEMGGEPEWIAEESRPLYHAALALGANHLVTLVAQSMELLRDGRGRGARPDARPAARRRPRQLPCAPATPR